MNVIKILLLGESNVGKTSLINLLGNRYFKVSNFSGTTVEKNSAKVVYKDYTLEFIDLPGVYSLDDYTSNEIALLVKEKLQNSEYDIILNVISATALDRNLNLTMDLLEQKSKLILAINMIDELQKSSIDFDLLSSSVNVDVVGISTKQKINMTTLLETIVKVHINPLKSNSFTYPIILEKEILSVESFLSSHSNYLIEESINAGMSYLCLKHIKNRNRYIASKLLEEDRDITKMMAGLSYAQSLHSVVKKAREAIYKHYHTEDIIYLRRELKQNIAHTLFLKSTNFFTSESNTTNKIDKVLLNNYAGIAIFFLLMWVVFETTFVIGSIPMEYIESFFNYIGKSISPFILSPNINSLVVDGILPGISAVMMFLPNIMILFLGITLLETTGYLTRVSFLLDGVLQKFGLHGQSIVPLIVGFGCTVPAYMAARTLNSKKDKLITLFVLGFISCSAKLPVYVLFISAFFEPSVAGSVLFGVYIFGIVVALLSARFLNTTVFKSSGEAYMMEMPKYRLPSFKLVYMSVWLKSISYVKKAGFYITIISTVIWFASSYPKNAITEITPLAKLESSYLGQIGKSLEPIFAPLGFDWKMSISLISGAAAKEVIVSTLSVLYVVDENNNKALIEQLRDNISFASAISFIVFIALYLPCFAATIVFSKESGDVKYLGMLIFFTLSLSWISSFIVYNVTKALT